jgi:HAD superfamily hydrolase (TIGR01484 family)
MIRLIGIDVDGTLLGSHGDLPEQNAAAIRDAVAAGIHVALVTGRSYPFARPVADSLPDEISLIVSNGAVERGKSGSTLARRKGTGRLGMGLPLIVASTFTNSAGASASPPRHRQ